MNFRPVSGPVVVALGLIDVLALIGFLIVVLLMPT